MFGLITGAGFPDLPGLEDRSERVVATPFGPVAVSLGRWHGTDVVFLPRGGPQIGAHHLSEQNDRANVWGLHRAGAQVILTAVTCQAADASIASGSLVLVDDFVDRTKRRDDSFADVHDLTIADRPSMDEAYSPALRSSLLDAAEAESISVLLHGTYGIVEGPRQPSAAEVRMLASGGVDLIGFDGYPEVALARERSIPYSAVAVVVGPAPGVEGKQFMADELAAELGAWSEPLTRLIARVVADAS